MILARLLTPKDFGLIAMANVIIGFAILFKDLGLSTATIQKQKVSHAQSSTLFWINSAASIVIMLVIVFLAPTIARFYEQPRLTWVMLAMASVFIFSGLTVQQQALLKRQMRFGRLALIEITAITLGVLTAIVAGWYRAGYWALVLMNIVIELVTTTGIWLSCKWRPKLPVRNCNIGSMLKFGIRLTGFNILNCFTRIIDSIMLGKYWGTQSLGLYSKAYNLSTQPLKQINTPISNVAVSALSRLQHEPARYRSFYIKTISPIMFILMPNIVFMILMAKDIISVVLGHQWIEAATIFSLLSIAALFQPLANTSGWLFVSQGRTRHMLYWGLFSMILKIIAVLVGLHWGAVGVAASYAAFSIFVKNPVLFWFVGRKGPVQTSDFYRVIVLPSLTSLCVMLLIIVLRYAGTQQAAIINMTVGFVITNTVVLLVLFTAPGSKNLRQTIKVMVSSFSYNDPGNSKQ